MEQKEVEVWIKTRFGALVPAKLIIYGGDSPEIILKYNTINGFNEQELIFSSIASHCEGGGILIQIQKAKSGTERVIDCLRFPLQKA